MKIDLVNIPNDGLILDQELVFPEDWIKNSEIIRLIKTWINGRVYINSAEEVMLEAKLTGKMVLLDAVDASEIEYPFEIEINENLTDNDEYNLEKEQNTLDIISILWQNIVLEVPIRVTNKNSEDISLHGEGWEFVSKEDKKVDPRMAPLLDLLKEGKE